MWKTIKAKITGMVLFILLAGFLIQMLAYNLIADEYYIDRKEKMITIAYREITKAIQENREDEVAKIINWYEEEGNIDFILADQNYKHIYNSRNYRYSSKNKKKINRSSFNFEKRKNAFIENAKPVIRSARNEKTRLSLFGIINGESKRYYIVIRTSMAAINEQLKETNYFVTTVSVIALLAGGILAYFFSKRIAKPVEEIDSIAVKVSSLDFSQKAIEYHGNDEISRLAKNINRMSDSLEQSIQKLQEANHKLELENKYKEQVNENRKEFVANVSHELKTPLAVLSGYAEVLLNQELSIDRDYYYSVILDETKQMTSLVNKLLEVSTIEHELMNMEMQPVHLDEFISDILKKNYVLFEPKNIKCNFHCNQSYVVQTNEKYLERAFMNYITNAIRYTKSGHKIEVYFEENKSEVRICVFNEGDPIEKDTIEHLWESFYRSDRARTRTQQQCIGLGLYLVATIMEHQDGSYGVENKETGVMFWLGIKK